MARRLQASLAPILLDERGLMHRLEDAIRVTVELVEEHVDAVDVSLGHTTPLFQHEVREFEPAQISMHAHKHG